MIRGVISLVKKVFSKKKIALYVIASLLTYMVMTVFIIPYENAVEAVTYRHGSRGSVVSEIQTRLKRWGYYNGSVDGIFGYQTYLAVRRFQAKNGLSVDGIAGDKTLAALGIPTNTSTPTTAKKVTNSSSQDVTLLARVINGEARGEPYEGQVAVGAVVMNRTRDSRFPSTIAGVIYQPGAFTAIVDGQIHATLEQTSINAARDALNGWDPSGGAVFYYNPAKTTNKWIWSRPLIKVIGKHRFCK
jgi:N-acetylmuramoyl-L-alanine amidase